MIVAANLVASVINHPNQIHSNLFFYSPIYSSSYASSELEEEFVFYALYFCNNIFWNREWNRVPLGDPFSESVPFSPQSFFVFVFGVFELTITTKFGADLFNIGLTVYSTNAKAGLAPRALWGLATSTVQYLSGQYIDTTIDIVILVT